MRFRDEDLMYYIKTRPGDVYDATAIERDFNSLWNTGYFEDIRFEREQTPKGWILHVYVKERPTIREITYTGLNSVTNSDVLERFKQEKLSLSPESQYDPTKVKKPKSLSKNSWQSTGGSSPRFVQKYIPSLQHRWVSLLWSRKGRKSKSGKFVL